MNKQINKSINKSINQSIKKPDNQLIVQSTN